MKNNPLRVGIGGPVGSGKTALLDCLCKQMRDKFDIAVITNDIYTKEDANFLINSGALPKERILGVETGGCPHTAVREDASINLIAVEKMCNKFKNLDLIFIESGGDNLAATFSPELADIMIYAVGFILSYSQNMTQEEMVAILQKSYDEVKKELADYEAQSEGSLG